MKNLIIYCHPNPVSFNHTIKETCVSILKENNQEYVVRDLYELNFEPVLKAIDFEGMKTNNPPKDVKIEQDLIKNSDRLIFIFPIWWTSMPARLKGFIDRVFTHGFAYNISSTGINGLLNNKKVLLINTAGSPYEAYVSTGMFQAINKTMINGIFKFCGIENVIQKFLAGVPTITDNDRKKMLNELKDLILKN